MTARRSISCLALILLLLAWGCATTGARSNELLARDYSAMPNQELQTYYLQLNDQIARVERQNSGGPSAGAGRPGDMTAAGTTIDSLRDRRNAVRAEMAKRGLLP